MDVDLGFKGNQYNDLLSLFFIPYVLFAFSITLVGKAYGPSKILPILMFIFGAMTLCSAATKNFVSTRGRTLVGESVLTTSREECWLFAGS